MTGISLGNLPERRKTVRAAKVGDAPLDFSLYLCIKGALGVYPDLFGVHCHCDCVGRYPDAVSDRADRYGVARFDERTHSLARFIELRRFATATTGGPRYLLRFQSLLVAPPLADIAGV